MSRYQFKSNHYSFLVSGSLGWGTLAEGLRIFKNAWKEQGESFDPTTLHERFGQNAQFFRRIVDQQCANQKDIGIKSEKGICNKQGRSREKYEKWYEKICNKCI